MKKKFLIYLVLFLVANLFFSLSAQAICPVCTVAVCAGVGLSRWLKIDDLISGTWIGGLIVSVIFWILDWLNKKQIKFKLRWLPISVLTYFVVLAPLYWRDIIGHPENKFYSIDKLLFGIIIGSLVFLLAIWLNNFLKKKNQGKQFFPFQKVVIPILFLIITSLIFYLISC